MAACARTFNLRLNMSSMRLLGNLRFFTVGRGGVSLYEPSSIGINQYLEIRNKIGAQFQNPEKYREKMRSFVSDDSISPIFTDDLKNMVYLSTKNDIELIEMMVKKFNKQNQEMRFGNYVFGPVIMRMYHHLDEVDAAYKIFEELKDGEFFNQISSHHILMDLLYKHKKYDNLYKVFKNIVDKQIHMIKYPKSCVNLVFAACYKQNTLKSLEYSIKLWTDLTSIGHDISRRTLAFFAALAINQNKPHIALEAFTIIRSQKYISILNLKVAALAELKRLDDVMPILRSIIEIDADKGHVSGFAEDIIERIKSIISKSYSNTSIEREFNQILKGLSSRKLIIPTTIDEILCQQIKSITQVDRTTDRNLDIQSHFPNYKRKNNNPFLRSGLNQMY